MATDQLTVAFLRRGYSSSGGAETYLQRLAQGVCAAGHRAQLVTTEDWPAAAWPFGPITFVRGKTPPRFADEVEQLRPKLACDVLMSLERIWRCDVFRAGDGVHAAWLQRRAQFGGGLQNLRVALNPKHQAILRLEETIFSQGGAGRVIANSRMVKQEITDFYGYPADRIEHVPNGVPAALFRPSAEKRAASRAAFGLSSSEIAVLFAGSGWERKGLRFAIDAVDWCANSHLRLLVAGRGSQANYPSQAAQFLGVVSDLPMLFAAADIFILPTIYDPFSNACLEAVAAGVPVITTRCNGFSEVVDNGIHGSVIEDPANIEALGSALRLWSDERRREEARPKLLDLAARFDISINVARTLEILLQARAGG
ncbi:MAG: glycosyltransferase family 4 protein [Chthoniobacterales bacterium]